MIDFLKKMKISHSVTDTRQWLAEETSVGKSVGFVPTMGALHEGHLNLVRKAAKENDLATCSIFVNPIQFNNTEDLAKYPRTIERDVMLLEKAGCELVLIPSVEEMYPEPVTKKFDFGALDRVMEGAHRPGHFNGVAVVVEKLFDIFRPQRAYFGEKDFQQLRIIQSLVKMENIPVKIVPCPTVRESDGLAMSSRNRRLSAAEREVAPWIYKTLLFARDHAGKIPLPELQKICTAMLEDKGFRVDYFEIAEQEALQPVVTWQETNGAMAFVAAFLGDVRLIDNMILFANFAR
jgi:pantoate--beta-alanine ligase